MAKNNLMCTVTGIISLWNWDLLSKHTTGYISSIALNAHCFGSVSSSLSIFYHGFELMFFFLFLSLSDPWRPEAGHSCCLRLPQPITVPAETRAAQTPVIFHSSVLEPNILSLSTDSLSLLLYDVGRSLLLRFFPSFSSVGVFNFSLFQSYALQ